MPIENEELWNAIRILRRQKPTEEEKEVAYNAGVIRKKDLKPGAWYVGHCRNASLAFWDAKKEKFTYVRNKFGYFLESIEHPEDDTGFDVFVPVREVDVSI